MTTDVTPELEFYRAVEDLFSTLRGVPHVLSPKDFQLLRTWWKDQVPLSAVRTGVAEVFARRRERNEIEPVVSLTYCRHAVESHARRIAEMRVGTKSEPSDATPGSLRRLAGALEECSRKNFKNRPRAAAVIERISHEVGAATEIEQIFVEEHLYALETSLLTDCLEALEVEDRNQLENLARSEAARVAVHPEAVERTFRALRDRALRTLLELPRMEIAD